MRREGGETQPGLQVSFPGGGPRTKATRCSGGGAGAPKPKAALSWFLGGFETEVLLCTCYPIKAARLPSALLSDAPVRCFYR